MIRIYVICEGQTEEMFVNEVLYYFFYPNGISLIPILIGKPGHKGGNFKFERLLTDLKKLLLKDSASFCTTLFDFYGLPENFPGKEKALLVNDISKKQETIHRELLEELKKYMPSEAINRFIPYVQMYEFEGLLFSHPISIAQEICLPELSSDFESVRNSFPSPEHVNNSPDTAPSKRIIRLFSQYDKVTHGSLIALDIGIDQIRRECLLFNQWIDKLLSLNRPV